MKQRIKELKDGEKGVAIWGTGYIGYSSMTYFSRAGVKCLGYDPVESRVKQLNNNGKISQKGITSIPNMEYWLGFDVAPMHKEGLINATTNWQDLINNEYLTHLICVPTERHGKPYHDNLKDVFEKLAEFKNVDTNRPPLAIIESTLSHTVVEDVILPVLQEKGMKVGKDILLGTAPRRDWFVDPDKTLKTLPRVVGGTNDQTTKEISEVLGIICNTILPAKDHKHAAIVKSIENAYRQLDISLANQLTLAYPDLDMREILKLVGTKWNMGTYKPSVGIGGYCIPLAPQYVIEGAKKPEELTLLKASLESSSNQPKKVVDGLIKRNVKNVGILGIAYTGDLKVHVLSPALDIIKYLKKNNISVKAQDPYYSSEEIKNITGVDSFEFPDGLQEFDTILVLANHMQYQHTNHKKIIDNTKDCKLIIDNDGTWKDITFNTQYHIVGDKDWLGL